MNRVSEIFFLNTSLINTVYTQNTYPHNISYIIIKFDTVTFVKTVHYGIFDMANSITLKYEDLK